MTAKIKMLWLFKKIQLESGRMLLFKTEARIQGYSHAATELCFVTSSLTFGLCTHKAEPLSTHKVLAEYFEDSTHTSKMIELEKLHGCRLSADARSIVRTTI